MTTPKLLIFILLVLEVRVADAAKFRLKPLVPSTVEFPLNTSIPSILSLSHAVSLSLATCPSPGLPIEFIKTNGPATIVIRPEIIKQLAFTSGCGSGDNITEIFVRLTSPVVLDGNINLEQITDLKKVDQKNSFKQFPTPTNVEFSGKGGYESFNIQSRSIENGLRISVALEYGNTEVFISHCADLEGKNIGRVSYPGTFEFIANVDQYVALIEETSCPGTGALYHQLDQSPPILIVRIKSANASGILSMNELNRISRSVEGSETAQTDIHLNDNDTYTLTNTQTELGEKLEFEVKFGSVSISMECGGDSLDYGTFAVGKHSLDAELFFSNETCLDNSKATLIFSSNNDATMTILSNKPAEPAPEEGMPWWMITFIVCGSAALVILIGFLLHQIAERSKGRADIEHATYNIPMNSSWM